MGERSFCLFAFWLDVYLSEWMFNMFENINKKYFSLQIILQFFLRKVLQHVFICPFIYSFMFSITFSGVWL